MSHGQKQTRRIISGLVKFQPVSYFYLCLRNKYYKEQPISTLNLLLLIVVAIIFWRLRNALGTNANNDPSRRDPYGMGRNGKPADDQENVQKQAENRPSLRVVTKGETAGAAEGLARIGASDRTFDSKKFLENAAEAYAVILQAYATHDRKALKPLVSAEVFDGFESVMQAREQNGQRLETQITQLDPPEIHDADLNGRQAQITVHFKAKLTTVLIDPDGTVVEGSLEVPTGTSDLWTFERDIKKNSPIWILAATESTLNSDADN